MRAYFAIPGDLHSKTGGYAYARQVLKAAPGAGLELVYLPLPGRYPLADDATLDATAEALAALPNGAPILIDGLAYGAFPEDVLKAIRAPVVALCHHPLALEAGLPAETAWQLKQTETGALAHATHVITTSNATAEIVHQDYGVDPARLSVAPPGTEPAPRAPGNAEGCRILSVGSITPRKGHPALVEALAPLTHLDWHLTIAGPAPDKAALPALQALIAQADLGSRVTLAGALGPEALSDAYQSADLFVLASSYEGFGMAFTEAMANGLPTVGLTSAAVEEATAGAACLVHAEMLPATLKLLIADLGTRKAVADRCWTAAQTFMRWPQTARIIGQVLKEAGA